MKEFLVQFGNWAVFSSRKHVLRPVAASDVAAAPNRRHIEQEDTAEGSGAAGCLWGEGAKVMGGGDEGGWRHFPHLPTSQRQLSSNEACNGWICYAPIRSPNYAEYCPKISGVGAAVCFEQVGPIVGTDE